MTTTPPSPVPPHGPVEIHEADAKKVAFGAFVGTALEWYDFFLYGTAASLVFNRLYFATDDATKTAEAVAEHGGNVGMEPTPVPEDGSLGTMAMASDSAEGWFET